MITHSYHWDKPGCPLDRLTPTPQKRKEQNRIINKELKRNMQQRGQGALSAPEKGKKGKELIST
jgi:hypothetical protein